MSTLTEDNQIERPAGANLNLIRYTHHQLLPRLPAEAASHKAEKRGRLPRPHTYRPPAAVVQTGMVLDQRSLRQRRPGKRAKSESLECNSAWYSIAIAAR